MPLDSDVTNADSQLHVEFYECKTEGPWLGKPFVRIVVPGDKTNVIDQPARDDHKRRFQRHWLHFQMKNSEGQIIGTPLADWHKERPEELTEGQLTELVILKFQSVEQVATMSDGQVMRIGMGGMGLRERARLFLTAKNAQNSGAELAKAQAEIAEMKAMLSNLAMMQVAQPLQAAKPPRKPGWPKGKKRAAKQKVSVNVQHHDAATGSAGL